MITKQKLDNIGGGVAIAAVLGFAAIGAWQTGMYTMKNMQPVPVASSAATYDYTSITLAEAKTELAGLDYRIASIGRWQVFGSERVFLKGEEADAERYAQSTKAEADTLAALKARRADLAGRIARHEVVEAKS